jgi:cell division protease FtsH
VLELARVYAADNELDDRDLTDAPLDEEHVAASMAYPPSYTPALTDRLLDAGITLGAMPPAEPSLLLDAGLRILPLLLILALLVWFVSSSARPGGSSKNSPVEVPDVGFDQVAGVDEAVAELRQLVDYLHDPHRFRIAGARAPKGVLLEGPPGTGKTLLARAVAGEAGVPFFAVSGSDFVETFAGVGARRVRDLFARARKARQAVVFIDEIDAIGRSRSSGDGSSATSERENTLNALLVEMNGFKDSAIIVLAATNRSDMLDAALTRPGRFDRKVTVPAPDAAGRRAILAVHAADKQLDASVDLARLSKRTPGMTGADLENLLNTAALEAAARSRSIIDADDVEQALQTVALGRARTSAIVADEDRTITAWHEAGHTIAALLLDAAQDPVTVTIVPRGPSGGTTWMSGSDRQYLTRRQALAQLTVKLAGRAAEELLLDGDYTQGAAGDLQAATDQALMMVTSYGMGGTLSSLSAERYQAGGSSGAVDQAVEALLGDALGDARVLLEQFRAELEQLVAWLLEDETVASDRLEQLRTQAHDRQLSDSAA